MFDVAKNLLHSYRILDESIDNGYDTVETKATYILLDAVLNSTCTWVSDTINTCRQIRIMDNYYIIFLFLIYRLQKCYI